MHPNCPEILEPHQRSPFCSLRFKLFLVLFRLKVGCSFHQMESIFGWGTSSIQEWFEAIITIMHIHMHCYHDGILIHLGRQWQENEIMAWFVKHIVD